MFTADTVINDKNAYIWNMKGITVSNVIFSV